jgi:hypothetical protein
MGSIYGWYRGFERIWGRGEKGVVAGCGGIWGKERWLSERLLEKLMPSLYI